MTFLLNWDAGMGFTEVVSHNLWVSFNALNTYYAALWIHQAIKMPAAAVYMLRRILEFYVTEFISPDL